MAKGYWIATYFSVSNPDALAEYAKLAGPAISAGGGRFLARGTAAKAYEKGVKQPVVLIKFDSVEKAAGAHDSPGYQAALKVLGNAVERDLRIPAAARSSLLRRSGRRGHLIENLVASQIDDLPRLVDGEGHRILIS